MEIANSKNLLVKAFDEDGKFFIAFEYPPAIDEKTKTNIISIEHLLGNDPATTVHIFKDKDEFIDSITWHEWIRGNDKNINIQDLYIKFRV